MKLRLVLWATLLSIFGSTGVFAESPLPGWPDDWTTVGRAQVQTTTQSVVLDTGYLVNKAVWNDAQITFRARAPLNSGQVQIWAGFRCRDRDSRYVFALRGGNDNDIYLARYAPNGEAEFLGFAPLDFQLKPGVWYRLRVVILGNRFQIFLNDEKLPRLNVTDNRELRHQGSFLMGGGWLPAEYSEVQIEPLSDQDKTVFLAVGNECWSPPPIDKEALRSAERSEYSPAVVESLSPGRTNICLNGNWLFMPDYEFDAGAGPVQTDYDDRNWNVLPVPSFWTPALSWLYGETGFTNLDEFSRTKGVAESLYVQRIKRCESLTFDWRKTKSAWYRHYVDLPAQLGERHFELTFDAIAKTSDIWVNGIQVGTHTGIFGQVTCDISHAVRPGRNVIAVHVISQPQTGANGSNEVEGVAESVEVTSSMLHSMAHGMFQPDVGGIWQPVRLTVTAPVFINDCFVQPRLHGADIALDIRNAGGEAANVDVDYVITSAEDGALLYSNPSPTTISLAANNTGSMRLVTPHLNPKLWSPQDPNLYNLEVRVKEQNAEIDRYTVRFGFRTFTVEGSQFLLNGHPYWLRGADPFPNELAPNDATLAHQFMQIAHDGNVRVTRTHIIPFTSTWLDAADETGMGVSFEGTWPWLMLRGSPPDDELVQDWRDEFISLIKEYRNHPSIILWTVNNEMKFESNNPRTITNKWKILNDTIKAMRKADPTRPVVADSSYVRKKALAGYQALVKPMGLDDGDVDDAHRYYCWYAGSFFNLYDGEFNDLATPGRPLISQEMSTGYPNNDDGHPVRFYLFKHYTPQALVGDDAYENADPANFLKRQAFMTKELAEALRRTSHDAASGILFFAYTTWFQTPWLADGIKPWPAYYALKTALQPVLASAELYGRHFYSGTAFRARVCIVNDSEDYEPTPDCRLVWEFRGNGDILSSGQVRIRPLDYYKTRWLNVNFKTPEDLPASRVDGQLVLRLESPEGKIFSKNDYAVVIATPTWADNGSGQLTNIRFWSPAGHPPAFLSDLKLITVESIQSLAPTNILIVSLMDGEDLTPTDVLRLKSFVASGGRVLMLHPEKFLVKLFPEQIKNYQAKEGEIVSMHIPESPVFSGIEPLDLAWFGGNGTHLPIACTGVYQITANRADIQALADQCDIHGYLGTPNDIEKYSGTPLVELEIGKGHLLASELNLEAGPADPIAKRLLSNLIRYLTQKP